MKRALLLPLAFFFLLVVSVGGSAQETKRSCDDNVFNTTGAFTPFKCVSDEFPFILARVRCNSPASNFYRIQYRLVSHPAVVVKSQYSYQAGSGPIADISVPNSGLSTLVKIMVACGNQQSPDVSITVTGVGRVHKRKHKVGS
jgi:hypothetical protein